MRRWKVLAVLVLFSLVPPSIATAICDFATNNSSGNQPVYAWQNHFIALTRLGDIWVPYAGDGDSKTVPFSIDQGTSEEFEETWYIARDQLPNTAPFYRHYSSSHDDHLDSKDASTATTLGYVQELVHGYAFTDQRAGTRPLTRYKRADIFDHLTWMDSASYSAFHSPPPAGYAPDASWNAYRGYPRYGNRLDLCSVRAKANSDAISHPMQNSAVRVRFNPIWGNAMSEMTDLATGKQVISHSIGDMVNAVLFYGGVPGIPLNPTLSGGVDCANYGSTRRWAGSPVIDSTSGGTNPKWFQTTTRPLNVCHNKYAGTDAWSPLLWRGLFRVTTTLGCKIGGSIYPEIVEKKFEFQKDADAPFTVNSVGVGNGGWFLGSVFGDCRARKVKADLIDLNANVPMDTIDTRMLGCDPTDPAQVLNQVGLISNRAVMITNSDNTLALGFTNPIMVDRTTVSLRCGGGGCSNLSAQKLVIEFPSTRHLPVYPNWTAETMYYAIGTPDVVRTRLHQIHMDDNGTCLN